MNKRKLALIFVIALGLFLSSSNYQFQLTTVHAGDWEEIDHIDSMDDLNTDQMVIEGELVSQSFALAASSTNFVDATQVVTYGIITAAPPAGMGVDDAAHTTLQEESYLSYGYPTVASYTGGTLPAGWYNNQWSFGSTYTSIAGFDYSSGQFWTDTYDMSAYTGVRVKFDWRNFGSLSTEYDELYCVSDETSDVTWFHSPAGYQGSFETEQRDSGWDSTGWQVRWYATGLSGDIETWEGFMVDNIYLYGQTTDTYWRLEAVYRFDTVIHTYATERLYIDYDAGTSQEGLSYYGGITTNPTDFIGGTSGAEPDTSFDVHDELTGTPFYVKIRDLSRTDGDQDSWLIDRLYLIVSNNAPTNDGTPTIATLDDTDKLYSRYRKYEITTYHKDLDGYEDINYVLLDFQTEGEVTQFRGRFDQDTHIFSEEAGVTYWELDTAGSTYSENVNDFDVTWKFYIEWACPDIVNIILECYVEDSAPEHDTDAYGTTWDIETDLEYDVTPTVTDDDAGEVDRGDLDEAFHITGDVSYQGSALTPPSGDVDVMVAMTAGGYGSNEGPWEDDTVDAGGTFDVTCYADNAVGIETYTVKVVKEGTGYGGTDLISGADPTDDYIADAIGVSYLIDEAREDVSSNVRVTANCYFMYDHSAVTTGTVTWWTSASDPITAGSAYRDFTNSEVEQVEAYITGISGETTHGVNNRATFYNGYTTTDFVQVADHADLKPANELTVAGWVRFTGTAAVRNLWCTKWNGWSMELNTAHQPYFRVTSGSDSPLGTALTINTWVHIVGVYDTDGSSGYTGNTLYINGQRVGTTYDTDPITHSTNVLTIGKYAGGLPWEGNIDSVHIYTRALEEWEVESLYQKADISTTGLVLKMDSSSWDVNGGNWLDISGSATVHNGAIQGAGVPTAQEEDIAYARPIWDAIGISMWIDDGRDDVDDTIMVYAWLTYLYDATNVTDGTVLLNGTGMSYGSSIWSLGRSQSTVGLWAYNITSISGNTHGITVVGLKNFTCTGTDAIDVPDYEWDSSSTISFWFNSNEIGTRHLSFFGDGSSNEYVSLNEAGDRFHGETATNSEYFWLYCLDPLLNDTWYHVVFMKTGDGYIHLYLNGVWQDDATGWENDLFTLGFFGRGHYIDTDDFGGYLTDFRFYDRALSSHNIMELYQGAYSNTTDLLLWYPTTGIDYSTSTWKNYGSGNDATIEDPDTLIDSTVTDVYVRPIWDEIEVYFAQSSDLRTNIDEQEYPYFRLRLKYDNHLLDDGSNDAVWINGSSASWSTAWYKYYTQSTVGTWNFVVTSASENTYGITALNSASAVSFDEDIIWDEIEVYWSHVFDGRDNVGDQNYPCFSLRLKYDNHLLNDETNDDVSINGSVASWWSNYWYKLYTMETVGSWNFLVTSASENSYGITALDSASAVTYNIDIIWDRIVFTSNVNMTWTVIGYYINVSYTGTYEYDSTSWSGYATVANTSLTTGGAVHYEELTFATVANKTFYATVIEDAGGYDLTTFTTNTVWCVFDDVIAGSEGDMYWHKEVGYSRLIWGEVSTWKWQFNDSWIDNTYTLHAYSNSSTPEATGGIYGSGNFGGFVVGPYDVSWYYVNLTVNCEVTINGNAYDWEIWSLLMAVDIMHTIYIENFEIEPTDYYFWVAYQSNWNNATIMIWDALVNAGTSSADTILNGTLQTEGMYHWSRSTIVGTHNVSILINGSASALDEQNKDFSLDDAWWWYNFTYVIIAEDIEITTYTFFGATSDFDYMQYSGYINYDCTYNISEWSASWAKNETHTGSVSEGMFNIAWNKIGVNDVDANFTIVFVNGSLSLTINGFYGTAYKILRIDEIDVDNTEESQALTNITVNFYTNKDVDYYVYDRDDDDAVLVSGSSVEGSDYITWAKNVVPHAHYYAVKWTDGVTNIWYNASYWTFEENIDSLPKPQIDWDARDARRTLEFWNIVGLIVGVVSVFAIAYTYYNFDKRFKGLELPHYDTQQDDDDR